MSPARGFPQSEYDARLRAAQSAMAAHGLAALLLTTEPEFTYFTGFLTRFWQSPTRPWFLILPASGPITAVIPAIGAPLMAANGVQDIRTWPAPDPVDDGISVLADTLAEHVPPGARIGLPDGMETHLRMPLASYTRLQARLSDRVFTGDQGVVRRLRLIKSPAEIAKIEAACTIADRSFARVAELAQPGVSLEAVFRGFQCLCLEEGADWVPYLAGGAGPGGYRDVISPATAEPLQPGDVLMLDTGLVWDGYFCDFDRNFSIGPPKAATIAAHARLIEATALGLAAARPGQRAADLHAAMAKALGEHGLTGRLGHGLGLALTEWPSLMAQDDTVLQPGMVLTLEPGLSLGHSVMVHEENIVITETGARYLTKPASAEIIVL